MVNSLWASGAEAISVGGVRIGPERDDPAGRRRRSWSTIIRSAVPYAILAVGPPNTMRDAFDRSSGLQRLRLLEASYGVGVSVSSR